MVVVTDVKRFPVLFVCSAMFVSRASFSHVLSLCLSGFVFPSSLLTLCSSFFFLGGGGGFSPFALAT